MQIQKARIRYHNEGSLVLSIIFYLLAVLLLIRGFLKGFIENEYKLAFWSLILSLFLIYVGNGIRKNNPRDSFYKVNSFVRSYPLVSSGICFFISFILFRISLNDTIFQNNMSEFRIWLIRLTL